MHAWNRCSEISVSDNYQKSTLPLSLINYSFSCVETRSLGKKKKMNPSCELSANVQNPAV